MKIAMKRLLTCLCVFVACFATKLGLPVKASVLVPPQYISSSSLDNNFILYSGTELNVDSKKEVLADHYSHSSHYSHYSSRY